MSSALRQSIPRRVLYALLLVEILVFLPLYSVLPLWFWALAVLVFVWRSLLLQMRRALPAWPVKLLLVVGCLAAIFARFGSFTTLEALVTLLSCVYCLKLLEMKGLADAQRVCLLSFFLLSCVFLFERDMLTTLYVTLVVFVQVTVLVGLSRFSKDRGSVREDFKVALRLLAQALPLMLILFVLAPRLPPLWAVPLPSGHARTGLSDEMAPGDIARLSQSDALVFRARFEGAIPEKNMLYWRALTLSGFDGRRWYRPDDAWIAARYGLVEQALAQQARQSPWLGRAALEVPSAAESGLDYELLLEPADQPWLYALSSVVRSDAALLYGFDFTVRQSQARVERSSVRLHSVDALRDTRLATWKRRLNLALPQGNPKARVLSERVVDQAGGDPKKIVTGLQRFYQSQPFFYTLRPPRLEGDSIDQFLFETRRGFCAHYAGSMVFLLRAAGIPARVVAGYQGGEIDPAGFVQVRQFDAHAWVEAWLPDSGWQRLDPTAFVSPTRIEQGLAQATQEEGSFLADRPFSPLRYQHVAWLNLIRQNIDRLEYRWQRWVINFDQERQHSLLSDWLGEGVSWKSGVLLVSLTGGCFAFYMGLSLWRQRVRRTPLERLFLQFCARLHGLGFTRRRGETVSQLVARVAEDNPALAAKMIDFERLYRRLSFDPQCACTPGHYRLLKRYLRKIEL